jgi:phage terminase small subunit
MGHPYSGPIPDPVNSKLDPYAPVRDPRAARGTIRHLDPPDDLSDLDREVWDLIVPSIVELGVLRAEDVPLVIMFVQGISESRTALRRKRDLQIRIDAHHAVDTSGMTDKQLASHHRQEERLDTMQRRCAQQWRDASQLAMRVADRGGWGPVARARLGLAQLSGMGLIEQLHRLGEKNEGDAA